MASEEHTAGGSAVPLRLAVIIGSTRVGRMGETVAKWFAGRARDRPDLAVSLVDLADYAFPGHYPEQSSPSMRRFTAAVGEADAFAVVTPEYNRSFPASLKQAIDYAYDEWQAKPVGFVAYGSGSSGLYAVEQLRTVFSALHVVTVRDWVGLDLLGDDVAGSGEPYDTDDRVPAVAAMLDQLTWWGRALRDARHAQPYCS